MPRPLCQIDDGLRKTSAAKAAIAAGDPRRQGAMERIDEPLDERLQAAVRDPS